MQLKQLSLTQFRNFTRFDVDVPPGNVLIVGSNAQGKTSILEAIYYLATFTSFHADNDRQIINFLESKNKVAVARIVARYSRRNQNHQLEVRIIQEQTKNGVTRTRKEILLDGKMGKIHQLVGHFNAVIFLPQMLRVLEGSPAERRRYLNLVLSQVIPHYTVKLTEYRHILSQRNALLKQLNEFGGDTGQLDFWDERLSLRGSQIINDRIHAIKELDHSASLLHHKLTRGFEVLRLDYLPAYDPLPSPQNQMLLLDTPTDRTNISKDKIETGFREALVALRREEISRGVTTIGPHRDELRFLSNGIDLSTYGSRGQIRTTMLSVKLAEVSWMHAKTGQWPVVLLDEVLAELDVDRREDLLNHVFQCEQTLLTTTDLQLFSPDYVQNATIWKIHEGILT
jgi:DNA replication and repair protein RecF